MYIVYEWAQMVFNPKNPRQKKNKKNNNKKNNNNNNKIKKTP